MSVAKFRCSKLLKQEFDLLLIYSSIAHELNSPLNGISIFLQLAEIENNNQHLINQEIEEMKQSIKICQAAVQNLFTRANSFNQTKFKD